MKNIISHHTQIQREKRFSWLIDILKEKQKTSLSKLIAFSDVKFGFSEHIIFEILGKLEKINMIEILGDEITFLSDTRFESDLSIEDDENGKR